MSAIEARLRSADLSDAASLAELSCQLGYATTEADARQRLSLIDQQDRDAIFVAESSRRGVIGWVHVFSSFRVESAPFAELGGLVVAERCRGMGVGRLLVGAAERWSRERGFRELRVRSNVVREDVLRFYEHLGFDRTKSQSVFSKRLRASAALVLLALLAVSPVAGSTCYGTTSNGALQHGCKLPSRGPNFSSFTTLGALLGRTWVHCAVARVVADSYAALHSSHPGAVFVTGETGRAEGGEFKPHKTHQNGLSVDFMVPVVDRTGKSVPLPTGFTNKFGYSIEFDANGDYEDLSIDFEVMAAHLAALRGAAKEAEVGIWRVIFDPQLQRRLRTTVAWPEIKDLEFSERPSWVRHDEHYHVDFEVPCKPLSDRPG